jgi:methyl-accepting chemotaxis protein
MKQWTIGRRLTVGFCAVITLAVALGAYASYGVLQIQRAAKAVTGDALPGIIGMDQADAMAHENDALAYRHIASESDQQKAEIEKQMAENSKTADAAFRQYETSITTTRDRELFEAIAGPRAENTAIRSGKVLVLSRAHKTREALAAYEQELAPVFARYTKALRAEVDFNRDSADTYSKEIEATVSRSLWLTSIGLLLVVIIGVLSAWFVTQTTNRALRTSVNDLTDRGRLSMSRRPTPGVGRPTRCTGCLAQSAAPAVRRPARRLQPAVAWLTLSTSR